MSTPFAQGARRARAVETWMRDGTSAAHALRRDRFKAVVVIATVCVLGAALALLSTANGVSEHVSALGRAVLRVGGGASGQSGKGIAGRGSPAGVLASLDAIETATPRRRNAALGMRRTKLTVPIIMITLGTADDDQAAKESLIKLMERTSMTPEELKDIVFFSKGVDATAWPDNMHLAEYAVRDVRKQAGELGHTIMDLPWLQIMELSKQTKDGKLPVEWRRLAHHVGCLYAHLAQWQLVKDMGLKHALIFESDGVGKADLPFTELPTAISKLPRDADLLLLSFGNTPGGDLVAKWPGHGDDGVEVEAHLYKWDQFQAVAGLQCYVITQSFVRKVHEYIAHKGADMIDAWLLGKMCVVGKDKDWNMRGLGETDFMPPGSKPILNCYHASTWA
jgi:hypothetical protein